MKGFEIQSFDFRQLFSQRFMESAHTNCNRHSEGTPTSQQIGAYINLKQVNGRLLNYRETYVSISS